MNKFNKKLILISLIFLNTKKIYSFKEEKNITTYFSKDGKYFSNESTKNNYEKELEAKNYTTITIKIDSSIKKNF